MILQVGLQKIFTYEAGNLIWTIQPSSMARCSLGDSAGSIKPSGYIQVKFIGKLYLLHHLVWLYHYGYLPEMLDHIDGNVSNNKIENLRECNQSQNMGNREKSRNNTSGFKGVHKLKNKYVWTAKCGKNYLGRFPTKEEAAKAYNKAAIQYFGEFAKLNEV